MANFTHGQLVTINGTIANIYDHSGEVIIRLPDGQAILTNAGNVHAKPIEASEVVAIGTETAGPKVSKAKGK